MTKLFQCGVLATVLAGAAAPAAAGDINLTITNGRVTLVAQDVTVRQILAEWARVGETQIENAEKMLGGPITVELRDVPESKVLEILLRSAAGYVVAPRLAGQTGGGSGYGRIVILATSQAPVVPVSAPPTFNQARPVPQQIMPPVNNEQDPEPPNMMPVPEQAFPGAPPQPGMQPQPGMPGQQPQGPLTAPRPGPLPPPGGPGSPFQPQPARPPGTPGGPGGPGGQ